MSNDQVILKDLLQNKPTYKFVKIPNNVQGEFLRARLKLKEVEGWCENCQSIKPFHNVNHKSSIGDFDEDSIVETFKVEFKCVSCLIDKKCYFIAVRKFDANFLEVAKIGEFPQKELPRNKQLSKFFSEDKADYNKAVVCLANGYGAGAFVYFRRIVEKNIDHLLDMIKEVVDIDSPLAEKISELKNTSPMSDKISIANHALPDHLIPQGFNPLGQIYGLLSDGVHTLEDEQCLDKANDLQACLEYLISELAAHKKNQEDFKSRLSLLRKP